MAMLEELGLEDRKNALSDNMTQYAEGDINTGEFALRALGDAAGGLGDVIAPVMAAVTPDFVEEGIAQLAAGVMDTAVAKRTMGWLKANPEKAKNIYAAGNILGAGALGSAGRAATGAAKGAINRVAQNAPIELPGFYGGGRGSQIMAAAAVVPETLRAATAEWMSPKKIAKADAGINEQTVRVAQASQDAKADIRAGVPPKVSGPEKLQEKIAERLKLDVGERKPKGESQYSSFASGQMEYQSLINQQLQGGIEKAPEAIKDMFNDIGVVGSGKFTPDTLKKSFAYRPEIWDGVDVDDELISTLYASMKGDKDFKGWGIKDSDDAVMMIKHPQMFDDLGQESRVAGSQKNALYNSKKFNAEYKELFPEGFASDQQLQEFAAIGSLIKPKAGRGMDRTQVDTWLEAQKARQAGEKLTKEQAQVINKVSEKAKTMRTDSKGRVYDVSTHKSSSKTMGGVQNSTVFDRDGNIINMISDEHDLFGLTPPWMDRMINSAAPSVTNFYNKKKMAPDPTQAPRKEEYLMMLRDKYGAELDMTKKGGIDKSQKAMSNALERGIINYQPEAGMSQVLRSGGVQLPAGIVGAGAGMGMLSQPVDRDER